MVMLEPLISLIVCSCLGGPSLSPLTNHRSLRQGGQGSQGEREEGGTEAGGEGGGRGGRGEQHEVDREREETRERGGSKKRVRRKER